MTSVAAVVAFALCLLTASLASDVPFIGGAVLVFLIMVSVSRSLVKLGRARPGGTAPVEVGGGRTIVVSADPLTSIATDARDNRRHVVGQQHTVIEVETEGSDERVRQWLRAAPRHLVVLREILRDYDRLAKAAHEAGQENERLRRTVARLIGRLRNLEHDCERFQDEARQLKLAVERYRQDGEEMAGSLVEVTGQMDDVKRTLEHLYSQTRAEVPTELRAPSA